MHNSKKPHFGNFPCQTETRALSFCSGMAL